MRGAVARQPPSNGGYYSLRRGENSHSATASRPMDGHCPAGGLVASAAKRQGGGACAAPAPCIPVPRVRPPVSSRRAEGGAAPRLRRTPPKRRAQYMRKTAQGVRLRRWKRGIRGMQPCVEGGQKQEYWSSQRENQASPDADKARLEEDGGSLRGEGGPFTRELKVLPSPLNNSRLPLLPVPFSATTKAGSWPRGW